MKSVNFSNIATSIFEHYFPGTSGYDVVAALLNTNYREAYNNINNAANTYFVRIASDDISEKTLSDTLAMVKIKMGDTLVIVQMIAIDKNNKANSVDVTTEINKETSFGDNIIGVLLSNLITQLSKGKKENKENKKKTNAATLNAFFKAFPDHALKISVTILEEKNRIFTSILQRST